MSRQIFPRDAVNLDLRTVRVGDRIYTPLFIDLFPQELKSFFTLFSRTLATQVPWRISFLIESGGLGTISFKAMMAAILSWTSAHNALVHDAAKLLREIETNTDDAVVKLQVSLATWAPEGNIRLLRTRSAELAKAVEGWGTCEVSEVSGDAFAGYASSLLGFSATSVATPSVAPLSDVVYMLPFTRPASAWQFGAVLLRSPDGKPWPYQPGLHNRPHGLISCMRDRVLVNLYCPMLLTWRFVYQGVFNACHESQLLILVLPVVD